MNIKKAIEKVPGGLMVVPLMLGALIATIDKAHLAVIEAFLRWLGAPEQPDGHYYMLQIGGFFEALFSKKGILTLIALFLFCAGSQMNLRVGGRALKKGLLITVTKYGVGLAIAAIFALMFDPFNGLFGLSVLAIIAAMTNSNGGMYVALTGEYGNRSDVGAVAILSLNDGPLFTLVGLSLFGATGLLEDAAFPWISFLAVFLPIGFGMLLGNLDSDIRRFLEPGQLITIPFFAFALGTTLDFAVFLKADVLPAGITLGLLTTLLTGFGGVLVLWAFREKSQIAGFSEASTAGNAVGTPVAIQTAALAAVNAGIWKAEDAGAFTDGEFIGRATAQISISTILTAVLCPIAVICWDRYQKSRGVDGRIEPGLDEPDPAAQV